MLIWLSRLGDGRRDNGEDCSTMNSKSVNVFASADASADELVWAVASLLDGEWQIGSDRLTKQRAEDYALTLQACDCEAIAVRMFQ